MARAHVPQFGAWDDGLTYTAVFDEARAAKAGTLINPNDPAENPGLAAILYGRPASAPPPQGSDEPHGRNMANVKDHEKDEAVGVLHVTRPRHSRRTSRENLKVRRSSSDVQVEARPGVGDGKNEDPRHTPKGSPLHPRAHKVGAQDDSHHQAGVGSEANPSTPPRNAQSRGPPGVAKTEESAARQGSPTHGFGEWNTDPTAEEEDTVIFNQHKKKKKTREAMQNRTKCASPARNGNKSHKSGTSFEKDKHFHCTIL